MDDILAKKNRHLFLEEKDNVGNSFIANINKVAASTDVWYALKDHTDEIETVADNIDDIHTVAENIDNVNTVVDNIDDIEFVHSNIEDGTLEALLDRISNEGNDWLLRIAALGNRLLNSKNAFNYAAVATIPSDIAANATITLPESMSYLVGTHMLLLSWNGTVCYKDEQYKEIGTADTWSTTIKTLVPLKAGDKLEFRTVAVIPADTQVIATGSLENRTLADRFGDVCNVKDFGAVGDGVENDTAAFQAALATGKAVFVPEGSYKLTTNLTGNFCSTGNSTFTGGTVNGSTILRGTAQKNNDIVNVKDFGAKGDGTTDDTNALNSAIGFAKQSGMPVFMPAGIYKTSGPLIIYRNTILFGASIYTTEIKLAANSNCNVLETYKWEEFNETGGNNSIDNPDLPVDFSVSNLTINGNRENNYSGVASDNENGYGFICYGRSYYIDRLFIKNCAGCGIRFVLRNGANDTHEDEAGNKTRITNIFVSNTSYEGFVFEGAADVFIDNILVGNVYKPDATTTETLGQSLIFPGESIDGIVFDTYDPEGDTPKSQGTAEVGFIHSFSCRQGYCVRISGTTTRFTAENIHAEGGIGNILISAGAIGSIDKIQTRNNQYGAATIHRPHVDIQTSSGMDFGTIYVRKQPSEDGQIKDCVNVNGNNVSIDTIKIFASGYAGHGVIVDNTLSIGLVQVVKCNGTASDGTPSTALLFSSSNRSAVVRQLDSQNCDIGVRVVGGGFQEVMSGNIYRTSSDQDVDQTTDQITFDVVPNINVLRKWGVLLVDNNVYKYPSFCGKTSNVDASSTSVQTFEVAHNMWRTPNASEVSLCVNRGATTAPHVGAYWVSSTDSTNITVNVLNSDGTGNAYSINVNA